MTPDEAPRSGRDGWWLLDPELHALLATLVASKPGGRFAEPRLLAHLAAQALDQRLVVFEMTADQTPERRVGTSVEKNSSLVLDDRCDCHPPRLIWRRRIGIAVVVRRHTVSLNASTAR